MPQVTIVTKAKGQTSIGWKLKVQTEISKVINMRHQNSNFPYNYQTQVQDEVCIVDWSLIDKYNMAFSVEPGNQSSLQL